MQKLHDAGDKGADTDVRILDAYVMQCQAEAQEGEQLLVGCRPVIASM